MSSRIFSKSKNKISVEKQKQLKSPFGQSGFQIGEAMFEGNAGVIDRAIKHIRGGNKKILRICDIGCGPGYGLMRLAQKFPNAQIVGVDPSCEMIEMSAKIRKDFELKFDLVQDSLPCLPFEKNQFDYVMLVNVVYFLDDLEASLCEIRRILIQTGMIIIYMTDEQSITERIDFSGGVFKPVNKLDLLNLLTKLGFLDFKIDTFQRKTGETGHILKVKKL